MTKAFRIAGFDPQRAGSATKRPRLAIVSTFDDMCGIAGYTRFLLKQLEGDFDIDVFDLDQFFMRSTDRRVRKLADQMIQDFAGRAGGFDFVNIQLEYGILGAERNDIIRRFRWIAEAASGLSVTFHTILPHASLKGSDVMRALTRLKFGEANRLLADHRNARRLNRSIYGLLRRLGERKTVNVIVHTRRDMRVMRHVHRVPSVFHHPLAFLRPEQAASLKAATTRSSIPGLSRLPAHAKVIGVFGFLSEYKGFEVVIRALRLLPEDYHLLIFGGVHPNEIRREEKIYPYVRKLLDETHVDSSLFDALDNKSVSVTVGAAENAALLFEHPKNMGGRIHFLGPQTDEGFARGMAICDAVVLPYVEIGQSSSGPMSIAIEMGARVIAARNHAFLQFARYHPDSIEFFDVGNHLELAERLLAPPAYPPERRTLAYNAATNRALYVEANSPGPKRADRDMEASTGLRIGNEYSQS